MSQPHYLRYRRFTVTDEQMKKFPETPEVTRSRALINAILAIEGIVSVRVRRSSERYPYQVRVEKEPEVEWFNLDDDVYLAIAGRYVPKRRAAKQLTLDFDDTS